MEIRLAENYDALSRVGAELLAGAIEAKPDLTLVAATGDTPMGLYRELAFLVERGEVDASRLRVFQLDAYLGLGDEDPRSLYGWMKRALLDPLGIPEDRVVRLPGDAPDPEAACRAYERRLAEAGGFDFAILGLGPNGHLGFNEPPSDAESQTRVVDLTAESIASNARYWGGPELVPRRAMTAGMASLLTARRILLLVAGRHKREILSRTVRAPITPMVPASYLQQARRVTVLADRAAGEGLGRSEGR